MLIDRDNDYEKTVVVTLFLSRKRLVGNKKWIITFSEIKTLVLKIICFHWKLTVCLFCFYWLYLWVYNYTSFKEHGHNQVIKMKKMPVHYINLLHVHHGVCSARIPVFNLERFIIWRVPIDIFKGPRTSNGFSFWVFSLMAKDKICWCSKKSNKIKGQ